MQKPRWSGAVACHRFCLTTSFWCTKSCPITFWKRFVALCDLRPYLALCSVVQCWSSLWLWSRWAAETTYLREWAWVIHRAENLQSLLFDQKLTRIQILSLMVPYHLMRVHKCALKQIRGVSTLFDWLHPPLSLPLRDPCRFFVPTVGQTRVIISNLQSPGTSLDLIGSQRLCCRRIGL